ncbi:MAG: alginate export family protein, partial [Verrucomicrobiales bacterium]
MSIQRFLGITRCLAPFAAALGGLLPGFLSAEPATVTPVTTKSVAANRISSLPDYARPFDVTAGAWGFGDADIPDWLDTGLTVRNRYEFRDQDFRTPDLLSDSAMFTRSLAYIGIREILDPLRFAVEFEDSRRFFNNRTESSNEMNHAEVLQAYAELYFDDAFNEAPLSLRFGRMAFDSVDRRLISRNRYRNTINAFDGLRVRAGADQSPFELDAFSLRPVTRSVTALDESSSESWLHGVTGYIRGWSPLLVAEPYWLLVDQGTAQEKYLHTAGVHLFGQIPGTGWDHDWSFA